MPEGVTHIGQLAFFHCDSLEEVSIPASVTSFGEYYMAFEGCPEILTVTVEPNSCAEEYCVKHRLKYVYPENG